ncbi:MAG TPA: YeeE/YedE thiosulfate transporter family protein [Burkholderiaceae bacterium]|jgi:hypothetical protein|nr:YeeE/YedE thiosulfate transporter family protein [Burkholderiaceae bacterium]
MTQFTPVSALIGGALIGLSAVLLFWLNGRIAGISGVFNGLVIEKRSDRLWRALFLLGLVIGSGVTLVLKAPDYIPRQGFPVGLLLLAGLLVGFGTSRANGCTSGHGVCGLARFSRRSLVATISFLAVAIVTTYLTRHLLGVPA